MTIILDVDNTLVNLIATAREHLASEIGISPESIVWGPSYSQPFAFRTESGTTHILPLPPGFWERDEVLRHAPLMDGISDLVHKLHAADLIHSYVTRRPPEVSHHTQQTLRSHQLPDIPIVHCGHFHGCKFDAAATLGQTNGRQPLVLIDDSPAECLLAARNGRRAINVPCGPYRSEGVSFRTWLSEGGVLVVETMAQAAEAAAEAIANITATRN